MTTYFEKIELSNSICERTFPLFAHKDQEYYASGTACLIDDYLAVTAKHVFEDFLWHFEKRKIAPGDLLDDISFKTYAAQITGSGTTGKILEISQIYFSTNTDIAYIRFKENQQIVSNQNSKPFVMNFDIPIVGENITAFGYNVAEMELKANKDIVWDCSGAKSGGIVQEIHEIKRDSIRLPFPVFRTNARFDGGMSGGPILNEKEELCGVVCSNLPPDSEETEHASYVAVLWPSLMTAVDFNYPNQLRQSPYPIYDLVKYKIRNGQDISGLELDVKNGKVKGILKQIRIN